MTQLSLAMALAIIVADRTTAAPPEQAEPAHRTLTLGVGITKVLQLSTKEPLRQVLNDNETVARVSAFPNDPTKVLVTGLAFGMTRITLIGVSGKQEVFGPKRERP